MARRRLIAPSGDRYDRKLANLPKLLDYLGVKYRDHRGELWAPCPHPNHDEKRASWSIHNAPGNPEGHGSFYCFGCHFQGGPLDLVQAVLGFSRSHAIAWMTEREFWLEGVVELKTAIEVRRAVGLTVPTGLVSGKPLEEWHPMARDYAIGRGITAEQVTRWGLCYALTGDLAGRLVMPLRAPDGEWRSYHARTFVDSEKRYMNASTEQGYDPGAIFGAVRWPCVTERRSQTLVLTEGALDALACERAGVEYVGAVGGSEVHPRQLLQLASWGRIVMASDGDAAGDALAVRVATMLRAHSVVVRAPIPKGCDAQDLDPYELAEVLDAV